MTMNVEGIRTGFQTGLDWVANQGSNAVGSFKLLAQKTGCVIGSVAQTCASKAAGVWDKVSPHLEGAISFAQTNLGKFCISGTVAAGFFVMSHNARSPIARFAFATLGIASTVAMTIMALRSGIIPPGVLA